ncbi:putative protein TPRXL isoform X2 [Gouania willdenowi]|uniref:putative protein TPRXL isoform X2 n=1 Tax=Gouania willdenowi TaxID=441366 RepID=UPI0010548281|nr:putative protein TPRXL isoform X2 [Gouania willdenowi]
MEINGKMRLSPKHEKKSVPKRLTESCLNLSTGFPLSFQASVPGSPSFQSNVTASAGSPHQAANVATSASSPHQAAGLPEPSSSGPPRKSASPAPPHGRPPDACSSSERRSLDLQTARPALSSPVWPAARHCSPVWFLG